MSTEEELAALAAGQSATKQLAAAQEKHFCPFHDPTDSEKPCPYFTTSSFPEVVIATLAAHERAKHGTKTKQDEESKGESKKSKRMETKLSRFSESETPGEFRRKMLEFDRYSRMCGIKEDEISEDLYMACETPMKQKLLASDKVTRDVKSTKPTVMKAEIERLCKPKTNVYVERQQFHRLEQHEDEKINDFESRVRAKAALCNFSKGCKSLKCLCCLINTEEDMIKDVIMCNMRDKNTQRELWKRENEGRDLEEILAICRANEAIHFNQTALSNSVTGTTPKTCHECGKTGHTK